MKVRARRPLSSTLSFIVAMTCSLFLLVTGCGSVHPGTTGGGSSSPTVTIAASPTAIAAGASSTLTVTATNATTVTITAPDGTNKTLAATGGTMTVSPTATTTYTATASGASGTTPATATATVTVAAAAAPTVTISANPTSIIAGGASTLTVAATNASAVTVTGTDGSSYTLQAAGGTQSVTPAATTTYTATAVGTDGSTKVTATATVTVTTPSGPPTVNISVNPTTILKGGSATLTVTATNAGSVTVQGTDGSLYNLAAGGGAQPVSPATTTTYQATATGAPGTTPATASVVLTVTQPPAPTVTISANPTSIASGASSLLTVVATNSTTVTVTGTDGTNQALSDTGGTVTVSPTATTSTTFTYTATATGTAGTVTATATVTVVPPGSVQSITHVIFMLQENRSFDSYFGMINPYRKANKTGAQPWDQGDDGTIYTVDGIDDKLDKISNTGKGYAGDPTANPPIPPSNPQTIKPFKFTSTCVDDMSSAWEESFWDVNGSFAANRQITMSGFAGNASGFAQSCVASGTCSGTFTDVNGFRSMGYYDQSFFNYYYYMASQFALSDRWFSPVSSKTIDNRIATFSGGTTQGFVNDPQSDDHIGTQVSIPTIFRELTKANVSWKIYYTVNNALCLYDDECQATSATSLEPSTTFSYFQDAYQYLQKNPTPGNPAGCVAPLSPSEDIGDKNNQFCINLNHIAPLSQYYTDLKNGTLPSFSFIEAGYGNNDEHPGSGQSVLAGQQELSYIINSLMQSSAWDSSVFFLAYDEAGGPYEHVPPVPGHSNDFTDASQKALYPDIGGGTVNGVTYNNVAVAPDQYAPCVPPTTGTPTTPPYCDLNKPGEPGTDPNDVVGQQGFGAQIGFRVPNMVISPFVKRHYVSHIPMDHTAIIKFVEDRFINDGSTGSPQYLTKRDAAQPNLLDFFDFTNIPWASPPTPPTAVTNSSACHASSLGN